MDGQHIRAWQSCCCKAPLATTGYDGALTIWGGSERIAASR